MAREEMGIGGAFIRMVMALLLVLATFNPTGYSYFHWVQPDFPKVDAVKALAGVVLLIGWVIFFRSTMRSLGLIGVILALLFFGALVWVAVQYGWLESGNTRVFVWIGLFVIAAILGVGVFWSHVRKRLTGQTDVDEVQSR